MLLLLVNVFLICFVFSVCNCASECFPCIKGDQVDLG